MSITDPLFSPATFMKLSDIENACKGNFVWKSSPNDTKILQCNAEVEGSPDTALIVICGLSEMYGFDARESWQELSLTEQEFYKFLKIYRIKMLEAQKRINEGKWDIEINDLVQKVWIKSKLLQNKLRLLEQLAWSPISRLPNV